MLLTISKQKKLFSYSSSFLFSYSYSTTNSIDINKICIQIPNINFINKTIIEQQEKSTILYHIQYMYINVSFSFLQSIIRHRAHTYIYFIINYIWLCGFSICFRPIIRSSGFNKNIMYSTWYSDCYHCVWL